jgi:hypothetical protein
VGRPGRDAIPFEFAMPRPPPACTAGLGDFARISPLAPASLFVNDEIAQPVQPSWAGVPMRGVVPLEVVPVVAG